MTGLIPTALAPGESGLTQGGDIVLVCRNETGSTLSEGHVGMVDIARSQSSVVQAEGGFASEAVLNTMVIAAEGSGAGSGAMIANIFGLHQDLSVADGSDGRFCIRGTGFGLWSATDTAALAHAVGFPGMAQTAALVLRYTEGELSNVGTLPATVEFGKVIAIAREAAGADDRAKALIDGWHGFGTGYLE